MRIRFLAGLAATATACARHVSSTPPSSGIALRIVDASRAGTPLLDARLRLIGPFPMRDTVVCSDGTRQTIFSLPTLAPGRYQLFVARVGYDSRSLVFDVPKDRIDTVTVGLRHLSRDLENPVVIGPPIARCPARHDER